MEWAQNPQDVGDTEKRVMFDVRGHHKCAFYNDESCIA